MQSPMVAPTSPTLCNWKDRLSSNSKSRLAFFAQPSPIIECIKPFLQLLAHGNAKSWWHEWRETQALSLCITAPVDEDSAYNEASRSQMPLTEMRTSLLEILRGGVRLRNDGSEEGGEMESKLSLRPSSARHQNHVSRQSRNSIIVHFLLFLRLPSLCLVAIHCSLQP